MPFGPVPSDYDPVAELLALDPVGLWLPTAGNIGPTDAGLGNVAVGGTVGFIAGLGSDGGALAQSVAGSRPIYQASGGVQWVEFDGVDDAVQVTFAETFDQPLDRVSGWRRLSTDNVGRLFRDTASINGQLYFEQTDEVRIFSGVEGDVTRPIPDQDVDFVVTERHSGAASRLAVDDGDYDTGDAGTASTAGTGIGIGNKPNVRFHGAVMGHGWTDEQIESAQLAIAFLQGRVERLLVFADSVDGGGGHKQPKRTLPWWWQSYFEQWLDEIDAEWRERAKKLEAERARAYELEVAARREDLRQKRAEEARLAAVAAEQQRVLDMQLQAAIRRLQDEDDARRAAEAARVQAALAGRDARAVQAALRADEEELRELRRVSRSGAYGYERRFRAAVGALRKQGWRAKMS
jgi:hypothetical protein